MDAAIAIITCCSAVAAGIALLVLATAYAYEVWHYVRKAYKEEEGD